jgi:uncharacterized protein YkwD
MAQFRRPVLETLEIRRLLAFDPTGAEQELLQLTNRIRTDPRGEFSRLFSSAAPLTARDPSFQVELDFFNVNGAMLRNELAALTPVPPVAWNAEVVDFAKAHNARMINSTPPQHFHSNTAARRQALLDAGVNLRIVSGELVTSENVFGFAKSPTQLFASYVVDWGSGPGGMQPNRPHRVAYMNGDFEQVGHAITNFSGANFGPLVNTQVFANIQSPPVMVVGAVFEDKNDSGWYDAGEGIRRPTIEFVGAAGTFRTTGFTAGGYQIELPAGTYTATATGGGMAHPVIVSNIVVNESNVWRNLIYDPEAIPPDSLEPNNTLATATPTTGRDQTFNGLSIHTASDVDLFRFVPIGTGAATFQIQFTHAAGNLDFSLLNATGGVIATSNTTGNTETINAAVTRGTTYYLRVFSVGGAKNGNYRLSIDAPEPRPPVAGPDRGAVSNLSRSLTLNILANDTDPDGDRTKLVPRLATNAPASFSLGTDNRLRYTAPANFSGFQRTTYTVTDDQGLVSPPATVEMFVINFAEETPWQNKVTRQDVNGDNNVTPLDVLLIINDLNANAFRRLPTSGSVQGYTGFLDTNGDGMATPADILVVINLLNSRIAGGEGESGSLHESEWSALSPAATVNRQAAMPPTSTPPLWQDDYDRALMEMLRMDRNLGI